MKHLLLALLISLSIPAQAGILGKSPEQAAEQAARENTPALTIWIEATLGFRNGGAARELTQAHKAFAAHGYKVVSVDPYIENGDLQGFFVTYQKP